jgi:hypothetical protein
MVIGRFELTTSRVQNQSNGRAIVGNITVPCPISFRVYLMTYFGSLDHKKKKI